MALPSNQAGFVVRRVRPEEQAEAGAVTLQAYRADGFAGDPRYEAALRDVARRDAEAEVLVAVGQDGALLGTVTYAPAGSRWADRAQPGEAEFRMLGVLPAARGRGVGEALVRACLERARAQGLRRMVLSTQHRMHAAQRLYERLGFIRAPSRDWSPVPGFSLMVYALELEPTQADSKEINP